MQAQDQTYFYRLYMIEAADMKTIKQHTFDIFYAFWYIDLCLSQRHFARGLTLPGLKVKQGSLKPVQGSRGRGKSLGEHFPICTAEISPTPGRSQEAPVCDTGSAGSVA